MEALRRPRNLRPASNSEAYRWLRIASRKIGEHVDFSKADEMANLPGSLFLNIWVPTNATNMSSLPVKVWIYGGQEEYGAISDSLYNGCYLASDSIVVSVAYRIGSLGFLALEDAGIGGNFGVQDILLGLEWIQSNIAAFGGNPVCAQGAIEILFLFLTYYAHLETSSLVRPVCRCSVGVVYQYLVTGTLAHQCCHWRVWRRTADTKLLRIPGIWKILCCCCGM
jgi:hypothetical protein